MNENIWSVRGSYDHSRSVCVNCAKGETFQPPSPGVVWKDDACGSPMRGKRRYKPTHNRLILVRVAVLNCSKGREISCLEFSRARIRYLWLLQVVCREFVCAILFLFLPFVSPFGGLLSHMCRFVMTCLHRHGCCWRTIGGKCW